MTAVLKNVYNDKFNDIVDEYNTYQRKIKMNSVDVASGTYVEYDVDNNVKKSKFKIVDNVIISQNILAKRYTPKS